MLSSLIVLTYITNVCSAKSITDVGTKIVGGEDATIMKYPYMISIEIAGEHGCGGSLLKPNMVLTAAHCMFLPIFLYQVRAGSTMVMEGGKVISVVKYWNHPKYTPQFDYDVSVLKLKNSFSLSKNIQTITLQPVGKEIPVGTIGIVTGWGHLQSGGEAPKILQEVGIPRANNEFCKMNQILYNVTDRMICFGFLFGGKDACQMDSGGPLVVAGKQVGIVSWGVSCAVPLYPGVFTKISDIAIRQHIDNSLLH